MSHRGFFRCGFCVLAGRGRIIRMGNQSPVQFLVSVQSSPRNTATEMDALTVFGLFAVTAMLIFYALEDRSPFCVLGFAAACALGSAYGFLQGAWPFGVVEAIWAGVAIHRWRRRMQHA
jgi:hypothetical protein